MSFVDDNCVFSICDLVKVLVSKQEFLNGTDDDSLLIVDSIYQTTRPLLIIDSFYESGFMVKTVDCVLELAIQHDTVRDNNYCIKDGVVIVVVKGGKSIGNPSNGIGFSTTCGVFYQIATTNTVFLYISNNLFDNVELMISWEDDFLFFNYFT